VDWSRALTRQIFRAWLSGHALRIGTIRGPFFRTATGILLHGCRSHAASMAQGWEKRVLAANTKCGFRAILC
jgi:hypothetical protein